jgi:hypothetical protein
MAFSIGAPLPSHSLVTVILIFPAVIWTRAGRQASESRYSPDRHVKATTPYCLVIRIGAKLATRCTQELSTGYTKEMGSFNLGTVNEIE